MSPPVCSEGNAVIGAADIPGAFLALRAVRTWPKERHALTPDVFRKRHPDRTVASYAPHPECFPLLQEFQAPLLPPNCILEGRLPGWIAQLNLSRI